MLAVVRPGSSGSSGSAQLSCISTDHRLPTAPPISGVVRGAQLRQPATDSSHIATPPPPPPRPPPGGAASVPPAAAARVRVCGPSHIPVSTGQHAAPQPAQDVSTADCVMILVVLPRTCSRSNSLTHTGDILEYFEQTFLTRLSSQFQFRICVRYKKINKMLNISVLVASSSS